MDHDHTPNCESRLFGTKCTCDAAARARVDVETAELLNANDGKMPLASERARNKPVVSVAETVDGDFSSAIAGALKKLTDQGLTLLEANAVVERRIRG